MQIENKFFQGFRAFGKGLVEYSKQLDTWISSRYMQSIAFKLNVVVGGDAIETSSGGELLSELHKAAKAGKLTLDEVETIAKQLDAISLRFDYFNTAYWMSIKIEPIRIEPEKNQEVEEKGLTAVVEEDNIKEVVEPIEVVQQTEAVVEATEDKQAVEQKPKAPARKTAAKGK
jgi:hypothetical protein